MPGFAIAGELPLSGVLRDLADRRPLFHSEADFQHELARQITMERPDLAVRLEVPLVLDQSSGKREWLDMRITSPAGAVTALELKYATDRLDAVVDGERFNLSRRAAQDITTYDIVKDVGRIERFIEAGCADNGAVVLLTNEAWYWKVPVHDRVTGAGQFRVHEGVQLTGARTWQAGSGAGTQKGREQPIVLTGVYPCAWLDYSRIGHQPFRVLTISA